MLGLARGSVSDQSRVGYHGWAQWNRGEGRRYTLGVEEEVMLLDRGALTLVPNSDQILRQLSMELTAHTSPETHAGVVELRTGVHRDAASAVSEMASLRQRLVAELKPLDVAAAGAGMFPVGSRDETKVSESQRYQGLARSLRFLARREPTMALHVHVGVPDPEDAVWLLNRLRESVPLMLALSANSPFASGKDTGFASARTAVFGGFPRTGLPRMFASYGEYVEAIDGLIAVGALPDATYLWWDIRLQPALGTVEIRLMDAQSTVADSAALIALVQSLARRELEADPCRPLVSPEVLAENRFLAARDGIDADLIDPDRAGLVTVREQLAALLPELRAHAVALGCASELDHVARLAHANGAQRQRSWLARGGDRRSLAANLARQFTAPPQPMSRYPNRSERKG